MMIIDCISDTHGHYPELEGGDLLIVAGDLTARDSKDDWLGFHSWLSKQKYTQTIIVAGNHDNFLSNALGYPFYTRSLLVEGHVVKPNQIQYLCDSGTEFEGLKIWGSPWTKRFPGMNPNCMAFTVDTEEELEEKWKLIPDDIDILVTHSPPYFVRDGVKNYMTGKIENCGSISLFQRCIQIPYKLHVFGHIHEGYGQFNSKGPNLLVNASHVNERYEPVNKPIRIEL